jgi:hypothetical protein
MLLTKWRELALYSTIIVNMLTTQLGNLNKYIRAPKMSINVSLDPSHGGRA